MRLGLVAALLALVVGCSKEGSAPKAAEAPLVGGPGKRIAAGPVADLKLSGRRQPPSSATPNARR